MSFVMAHAAMLDVFYVTFMLLGFLLYLRGSYLSCGVAMGLSLLCKETALLAILAIVLHWAVTRRNKLAVEIRYIWSQLQGKQPAEAQRSEISNMFKLLAAAAVTWIVLLVPLEYRSIHQYPASTYWFNPIVRTTYMLWHAMTQPFWLGPTGYATPTKPWLWLIWPSVRNFNSLPPSFVPRYLDAIGWTVWALIIPTIVYLIYEVVRHRTKGRDLAMFTLSWLVGVYGLLIIMELITDRLTYDFYFYPAIPAVCLGIAWGVWKLWEVAGRGQKTSVVFLVGLLIYLLTTVATFIIMSPLGTNLVKLPLRF
jgi:predicted membrane-bound dolichyl-phosphate-mannose-protein mannosyltransferase